MSAQARVLALVVALAASGCADVPRAATPEARAPRRLPKSSSSSGPPLLGVYEARWEPGAGEVLVDARFEAGAGVTFGLDTGAEPFVRGAEASPDRDGAPWTPVVRKGRTFEAAPCARDACRIRYRYALRTAARRLDDVDVASLEGDVVEAPPSTWLLAPTAAPLQSRVRFRVSCPEGSRFVTGVYPSREAPGAWDATLDDLATSPYSAFGPLRTRVVEVGGATLEIALAPGRMAVTDERLVAWVQTSARAIAGYLGRFPMPHALVIIVPGRSRWIGVGKTLSGGGGTIFVRVGEEARDVDLAEDWVLVHEMVHLAFPSVAREQDWAEEGLATYVEPFVRVRAGLLTEEEAWRGLVAGLPNGLPAAGDRGLDRTPTWGRTYWGGALFYLLADVGIRKATQNRFGLEHALRGVLDAGGNNASRWALDDVYDAGDRAVGGHVLRDLHDAMGASPHPVDLAALFASLGIVVLPGGGVRLDPNAPLAALRSVIVHGP